MEGIGSGAVTAPFTAARDADVIIVIGARPTENHPVAATFFKQAAKRGAKVFVMDPRGHTLVRHATATLRFNPGRDVAMLNALLHTIIEEGLTDRQYIQAHTEDYEKLREHIRDYTPEKMAPICGIDAATLRHVARTYARAERAIIFWGMGISQHIHGTDNARCLIALAMITGQVGRPGTGLHPLRGQNNVQGASDAGLIPMVYPDYQSVANPKVREKFEALWQTPLDDKPGLTVVEIMDAVHRDEIKGMYIMGENPAMSDPDVQHAREALAHLEHLVVQDIFLTETAKYADVVLPASAWPEKDGTVSNTNRQVQMGRRALPMPGNAREDLWTIQEIARRMGLDWRYTHPRDVFAEMKLAMPSLDNITWERLQRENSVTYPCDAEDRPGNEIVFGDGFPTASGRAKLVPAAIIPPAEEPDAEYPMVLTTGRQLEHWHTGAMTRRASVLDEIEPEAVASLAPGRTAPARHRRRRAGPGHDPARQHRTEGARRQRRRAGHGVHPVLLCRGGRQHPDQPAARPVRQDPRIQILRRQGRAGRVRGRGVGDRLDRRACPASLALRSGFVARRGAPVIPARLATRRSLQLRCAVPAELHAAIGATVAPAPPYSCLLPAEQRMLVAELFFGRNIRGRGPLTDAEWPEFAAQTVTPNFPDGFTVLDGDGQWRNPGTGHIAREPTKILLVAATRDPDLASRLSAVIDAYKTRIPPAIGRHDHPRLLRRVLAPSGGRGPTAQLSRWIRTAPSGPVPGARPARCRD